MPSHFPVRVGTLGYTHVFIRFKYIAKYNMRKLDYQDYKNSNNVSKGIIYVASQ